MLESNSPQGRERVAGKLHLVSLPEQKSWPNSLLNVEDVRLAPAMDVLRIQPPLNATHEQVTLFLTQSERDLQQLRTLAR